MVLHFLESFSDLISSVIGMVIHFFVMVGSLLITLPKAILYITTVIGYMPTFVGSVMILTVSLAVIITIVNHWGN